MLFHQTHNFRNKNLVRALASCALKINSQCFPNTMCQIYLFSQIIALETGNLCYHSAAASIFHVAWVQVGRIKSYSKNQHQHAQEQDHQVATHTPNRTTTQTNQHRAWHSISNKTTQANSTVHGSCPENNPTHLGRRRVKD